MIQISLMLIRQVPILPDMDRFILDVVGLMAIQTRTISQSMTFMAHNIQLGFILFYAYHGDIIMVKHKIVMLELLSIFRSILIKDR